MAKLTAEQRRANLQKFCDHAHDLGLRVDQYPANRRFEISATALPKATPDKPVRLFMMFFGEQDFQKVSISSSGLCSTEIPLEQFLAATDDTIATYENQVTLVLKTLRKIGWMESEKMDSVYEEHSKSVMKIFGA